MNDCSIVAWLRVFAESVLNCIGISHCTAANGRHPKAYYIRKPLSILHWVYWMSGEHGNWWQMCMATDGSCAWQLMAAVHDNWWQLCMATGGSCAWQLVAAAHSNWWQLVAAVHGKSIKLGSSEGGAKNVLMSTVMRGGKKYSILIL